MSIERFAKAFAVTEEMIRRRNLVRKTLGDRYADVTKSARALLRDAATRTGKDILASCLSLCENVIHDGHPNAVYLLVAAAVDLIEEDEAKT